MFSATKLDTTRSVAPRVAARNSSAPPDSVRTRWTRIPQLAGDPGRGVGKRPGVGDGAGVTAGVAVSSGGVKAILDEGVHDESVCGWSDGSDR